MTIIMIMMIKIHQILAEWMIQYLRHLDPQSRYLRQKVEQNKLALLYRHLNVTGNPDLINTDQFKIKMIIIKTGDTDLLFLMLETVNHSITNTLVRF